MTTERNCYRCESGEVHLGQEGDDVHPILLFAGKGPGLVKILQPQIGFAPETQRDPEEEEDEDPEPEPLSLDLVD